MQDYFCSNKDTIIIRFYSIKTHKTPKYVTHGNTFISSIPSYAKRASHVPNGLINTFGTPGGPVVY